jgi:hypothetical protein
MLKGKDRQLAEEEASYLSMVQEIASLTTRQLIEEGQDVGHNTALDLLKANRALPLAHILHQIRT